MEVLNRAKSALMIERVPTNAKSIVRTAIAHGPIKALVEGSDTVWNTNAQRIDNLVGTKLAGGGPV